MSNIYEWEITGIKTKTEGSNDNSIVVVDWIKRAFDPEGNQAELPGRTPLSSSDTLDFTDIRDVTEAQVIGWVRQEIDEASLESALNRKLDKLANPAVPVDLPWA